MPATPLAGERLPAIVPPVTDAEPSDIDILRSFFALTSDRAMRSTISDQIRARRTPRRSTIPKGTK